MAVAKITKEMIERPEVPAQGHLVTWDSSPGMGGFGIRVASTGRVSFLVRFWNGSRERWKTLGAPPRLTLTEARKKARNYLRAAGDGRDPVEEEREAKADRKVAEAQTVDALAAEWLAYLPNHVTRRGRRISPRTVEQYTSCMNLYIVPALGERPVSQVSRGDVTTLHERATNQGGPYMANRVVSVLSIFYGYLQRREVVGDSFNPARKAPRNPEAERGEHADVRLNRDQESRLVRSIYRLIDGKMQRTDKRSRTSDHSDPVGGVALLTLLDTGRRKDEVLRMEWHRLNLDAGKAVLGPTKGKKAGDVCYLTPRVCEAIRRLPRVVGSPYVFHGHGKGGRRAGLQSAWELVKADAGLMAISPDLEGFHLHDLRHHRISELLAAGIAPQLVIQQVGHTSYDQLRVYGHVHVDDVAAVLAKLQPVEPATNTEVVEIATAR
jgi:integrase